MDTYFLVSRKTSNICAEVETKLFSTESLQTKEFIGSLRNGMNDEASFGILRVVRL